MCEYIIHDGEYYDENGEIYCSGYSSRFDGLVWHDFCYKHACPCYYVDPDHPTITPNNCGNKSKYIILNKYDDRDMPYMSMLCDECLHGEIKDPGYD